ncbi:ABC transporter ATP-binding protein [Ligilactobacillus cholophilus]|uniref:ABC transporter ATP-binding protein n=1 Tax=Ligilactobacillus cholophilus TaxID=3050131 RepID=UPI0025B189BD|nr:ABC transporter ATP-binding protein [Ligilactobacillus cholophilus]
MKAINTLIKLDSVSKSINNKKIIKKESFSINEGRVVALLGPNGAGKTTTVRLITGLLSVDSGNIKFNGKNLSDDTKEFRKYISVLNDGNLYEDLTLVENLMIWKDLYEISENDFQTRVSPLLAFFSLEDRKNDKIGTFSKGMKQKAAIIRTLINNPKLLILDEPTSGLDPKSIEELYRLLEEIKNNRKLSIILCTHQLYGI